MQSNEFECYVVAQDPEVAYKEIPYLNHNTYEEALAELKNIYHIYRKEYKIFHIRVMGVIPPDAKSN